LQKDVILLTFSAFYLFAHPPLALGFAYIKSIS